MRHARNHYYYLIHRIKKNIDLTVWRSLDDALLRDPTRDSVNSHCFGTLYGMYVSDHGRGRLHIRHARNHYYYLIHRIKKNIDLTGRRHSTVLSCVTPHETIGLK